MIDLTPYFNILGLPPDATWDQVEQRYRTLVIFWHPDRVSSQHHKALAEEELKKINNAKDKLKEHWRDWQNQPRSSTSYSQGSSSRANNAKNENAEKKNQDKERADDEARRKREAENRRREEKRRKQQADFETAYDQYSCSEQDRKEKDFKTQRLGRRLLSVALSASLGLLILELSSEFFLNYWIHSLKSEELTWQVAKKDPSLQKRFDMSKDEVLDNPGNSAHPFSPPMSPPH